jgi:hypothetical protein
MLRAKWRACKGSRSLAEEASKRLSGGAVSLGSYRPLILGPFRPP